MRTPAWLRLDPVTRKRIRRFRAIPRGFYSFVILLVAIVLSLFANYLANHRPIVMCWEGEILFPTFTFHKMERFGQTDDWGLSEGEADYRRLAAEAKGTDNWVLLPPIPFNPYEVDLDFYDSPPPHAPDSRHLLGTDNLGRDVAARLLYGFRISILFALLLTAITLVAGVALGALQGYLGGYFDLTTQRLIEVWSMLPVLYVVIILGTLTQANFWLLLLIMSLFGWMGMTYYMRTEVYREKSRDYCLAARAAGASSFRIVFRHLLPNCLTPLVTMAPFAVIGGITSLTALDYLGYGLPVPTPSWGELMSQALEAGNRSKPWLLFSPFVALTVTLVLVTFIGESVREAFDPKKFSRYD